MARRITTRTTRRARRRASDRAVSTPSLPTILALLVFIGARSAAAQVPTASMPLDDDEPAAAPQPSVAPASSSQVPSAATPSAPTPSARLGSEPIRSNPIPSTAAPKPEPNVTATTVEIPSLVESTHANTATLRPGYARLNVLVREAGATAHVVSAQREFDPRFPESALLTCTSQCNVELPLGNYSVWVTTADDTRSRVDLQLRGSRWVNVAPANQVMRDFGFVAGAVGTLATVLGVAILAEAICDTCTPTGRNITGALALGLGLPMGAVGWSLYFIHREARIEDRVLTQAATGLPRLPPGGLLTAQFSF